MKKKTKEDREKPSLGLRERLSGRVQMNDIHEVSLLVQNSDEGKQELYDLVFDENDSVAINALWIMTHFSLHENKWLYPKQDEMIDRLLSVINPSQKRLLLSLLYRQPLADPPRVDFLDFCLEEMLSRKAAPGITTLCMKLAYEMCRTIPELLQEFGLALDVLEPSMLPPSIKNTKMNVLKAMKKGKSLQLY